VHYDGAAWKPMQSGTTVRLSSIWGSGPSDVYAVGAGIILHYDGMAWSPRWSDPTRLCLSVWGTSSSDVWVATDGPTVHFDGSKWGIAGVGLSAAGRLEGASLWGSSSSDVYLVGGSSAWHFDGTSWSQLSTTQWVDGHPLTAVWGSDADHVYVAADGAATVLILKK
jgi:hypothetical protein